LSGLSSGLIRIRRIKYKKEVNLVSYEVQYIIFAIIGYLLGSILFAKIWGYVFTHKDITRDAKDHNPGTFNAFEVGGFWCGVITVICDLAKGFTPVFLCGIFVDSVAHNEYLMALVMLSPVIGHILPIFYKFRGGKGIAATFGSLLGLVPDYKPLLLLAIAFIVYSLIIVIKPDFYKTIVTYVTAAIICPFLDYRLAVVIAYIAVTVLVCLRLLLSKEDRGRFSLSLIKWKIIEEKGRTKV